MTFNTEPLEQRLLGCVGAGLSRLGDGVGHAFLRYLVITKQIWRDDIVANPLVLSVALRDIFGEATPFVLRLIVQEMTSEFGFGGAPRSFSDQQHQRLGELWNGWLAAEVE